jgi:serine/threonine-protein kinase
MIGQILDDRYRITDIFSSGVFGQTYLAEDITAPTLLQCIVRQHRLHTKGSETLKYLNDMLKKKLEALAEVNNHDQIPTILAYFDDGESFYLVEEYIDGHPLSEELEPHVPLAEQRVIQIMQEVLEVLAFMHDHRIIHQYIQPTTLIRRHADEKLMLTGSGVMREISAQLLKSPSQQHQPMLMHSSTIYTPIEQIKGHAQFNSDLYALGMVAIQALSGLPANVLSRVKNQNGASDGELVWQEQMEASPELVKILERMVHPDSYRRYQSARDVLSDLDALSSAQALSLTNIQLEDMLNAAGAEPELDQLSDLSADDTLSEPAQSSKKTRFYALVGAIVLMLTGGILVALVGGQLPLASSIGNNANKAANSEKNGKSGTSDRTVATSESERLFQEGQKHLASGKPQEAISSLTRVIQLDPENAKAFYTRGNIRMNLGDRQNAFKDYNEALRLDPDLTPAYVNRGSVRADLGDDQGAILDYSQAIGRYSQSSERDDTIAAAYLNRCLSRSNVGDQTGAIADCTQAISLQPDNVFAYQNRGLARRRLGEPQTAIQDFNIAMKLDPEDADSYYNRGLARRELGDYQGAVVDYTAAIKFHPGHALAYYDRALAKVELQDPDGAISDFKQSATLCLNAGRITCYNDAQYHIKQLQSQQL